MKPAPPVTRIPALPPIMRVPPSRRRPRGRWRLLGLFLGPLLGALLAVVADHALADLALVDAGDDVPEPLVHFRVVDQSAERALPLVDLAHDRGDVAGSLVHLLEEGIGVFLVVQHPPDDAFPLPNLPGGTAQRLR